MDMQAARVLHLISVMAECARGCMCSDYIDCTHECMYERQAYANRNKRSVLFAGQSETLTFSTRATSHRTAVNTHHWAMEAGDRSGTHEARLFVGEKGDSPKHDDAKMERCGGRWLALCVRLPV